MQNDYIKPSLDYIEQNLKTDIKTAELANMTGYSVTHYYRLFNKATGLSVANYISKKRINHALFEILAGRKAIDAVLEYGFDTYAGFYKAFVKMHGCSPMKYLTIYKNLTPKELEDILMEYNLTETQKNAIIESKGDGFYLKVLQDYELYSEKWKLIDFEFDENYHWFVTFYCKSELYGDCVLKIYDDDEIVREYNALLEYENNGGYCVKALGYEPNDHTNGAMLTERIFPGEKLGEDPSLEKKLAVYSEIFNKLHIEPKNPEIYGSYADGIIDSLDYTIDRREDNKELYFHALKAKEICLEIASVYNKKLLLHGGLHFGNILSCENGNYKIVNPAGIIGDPVFETGALMYHECLWHGRDPEKTETVINYLEKSLNIPNKIIRQCAYITVVSDQCSWVRWHSGYDVEKSKFAESIMNKAK
ncbi:MAG: helix-turn-helix domain-containing protein [Oscillospiraceae bacterium]|nr:helix-turn-helix domain-containing protein [Oscillospiraceae bacterium]